MKKTNKEIIAFLGEIILKNQLEKDVIGDSFDYSEKTTNLEKTLAMIFNEKVREKIKNGEKINEFHPFIKLRNIVDELINNSIGYEDLSPLIKEKLNLSEDNAREISLLIKNNKDIKELIKKEDEEKFLLNNGEQIKSKSIGYELLN